MIDVSHVWKKSYILESTMWMSIINVYDRCPINMNMMDVHHLWIWWMSIIYEWDEFPSCITYAGIDLLIKGTGERETIDQGLDGIEGKD